MLGEEILEEFIALGEIPESLPNKDIPIKGLLAFVRIEDSSAKIIFIFHEKGTYIKIPRKWLLFFSGLGNWGFERLPDGFIKDMAELCYGISSTSLLDPLPIKKLLSSNTKEFREWIEKKGLEGFYPIEIININSAKEI